MLEVPVTLCCETLLSIFEYRELVFKGEIYLVDRNLSLNN